MKRNAMKLSSVVIQPAELDMSTSRWNWVNSLQYFST